ncbi:MAG TPA: HD domain-containing phosphohydrolase [Anaerovoracaceae bacterium]|nr:HD domain-containing phosphohydrolase [Anaerovoracaceae bacterium]
MGDCKLQIGCILVVLYIIFTYYREAKKLEKKHGFSPYDALLIVGFINLIFDGVTAYTVNHLDTVDSLFNMIAHMFFLITIDALVFLLFIYICSISQGGPKGRYKLLVYSPFLINIIIVVAYIDELEYRIGEHSNYSMGVSAYTCFIMVAVYLLFTIFILVSRWDYIESNKRSSIVTVLLILIGATTYQMIFPEALVTSIGTTAVLLGIYMNQEDPAKGALSHYHDEMVMGFATLIENKDDSTGEHVRRTTMYVKLLEEELLARGYYKDILTKDYRNNLQMAAPMHDIGKIAIPDAILQKPGKLTDEEFEKMKLHTVKGGQIIQETFGNMGDEQYRNIAYEVALHHHEKWNGRGYPDGLKGEGIPLCARIMAVADVFDAVSEKRCYRDALPLDECFAIIEEGVGTDFDPIIAGVFLKCREKIEKEFR